MPKKKTSSSRLLTSMNDLNRPIRVATYRRASTDEGNQPYSLDAQRIDLDNYVALRPNWTVVHEFVERASAKDISGRAELQRLLAAAAAGEFDAVLVAKIDRWSRSLADVANTVAWLRDEDVAFMSVAEPFINTEGPVGTMMLQQLAMFAEFERAMTIERILKGNAAKIAKGLPIGGRLGYGLRRDRVGRIEADPATIGVVRRIFREYAEDAKSTKEIARGLSQDGLSPPGKTAWTAGNVSSIIRNRSYVGEIRHHDQWLPGAHEALVDEGVFEQAQEIADKRAGDHAAMAQRRGEFLLTGVLRCGRCGGTYVGASGRGKSGDKFRYYICRTGRFRGKEACTAPSVPAVDLEALVVDSLQEVYSDSALFDAAVQEHLSRQEARTEPAAQEQAAVETELAAKRRVRLRYQTDYEAGDLDARTYSERSMDLDEEIDGLRARLEALEAITSPAVVPLVPDSDQLAQMRAHLVAGLAHGHIEARKAVVGALVDSVTIHDLDDIRPVLRLMEAAYFNDPKGGGSGIQAGNEEVFSYRRPKWS